MWAGIREHDSHGAILTPRTPLHLGRPSRVQRYSSSKHRAMEEDSLMTRYDDDKLKCKTSARNSILRKPSNTKWGAKPATITTTALALCYSTAEYVCPVWERSTHVSKLDPALFDLRPTSVENVYLLAGIAPPGVRRATTSR